MEDPNSKRADGHDGEVEGDNKATTYRAYKRRYTMALAAMLLSMCNAGLTSNLASVSYKAADYFEVTLPQVNWFTEVYLIIPPVSSFVSTFTFNKFHMKAGIHIGSALICVGGVTRAVATSGLITAASTQYAVSLTGQVVAAMGSIFVSYNPTKVAQNWFPDGERILATTILVFGQVLGAVVSNAIVYFAGDLPDGLKGVEVCMDGLTSDLQARDYSAPLTGVMAVISLVVVLFVPLFHTPYKRRQVEEHTVATTP